MRDNNRSATVLDAFLGAVHEYGLPSRIRTDKGKENVDISAYTGWLKKVSPCLKNHCRKNTRAIIVKIDFSDSLKIVVFFVFFW